jgi:hypothetical protein
MTQNERDKSTFYKIIAVLTLSYIHETCVIKNKTDNKIEAMEMKVLNNDT